MFPAIYNRSELFSQRVFTSTGRSTKCQSSYSSSYKREDTFINCWNTSFYVECSICRTILLVSTSARTSPDSKTSSASSSISTQHPSCDVYITRIIINIILISFQFVCFFYFLMSISINVYLSIIFHFAVCVEASSLLISFFQSPWVIERFVFAF